MKSRKCAEGFIELLVLIVLLVLLGTLAGIHQLVRQSATRTSAMKEQLLLRRLVENEVARIAVVGAPLIEAPPAANGRNPRNSLVVLRGPLPALVEMRSTVETPSSRQQASMVLAILRSESSVLLEGSVFQLPDWERLMSLEGGADCSSWIVKDDISSERSFRAHRTCASGVSTSEPTTVIPGNVELEAQAKIGDIRGAEVYRIVKGELTLAGGLVLEELHDAGVNIICLGSVRISTVTLKNVSNTTLLIHSSGGVIAIDSNDGALDYCQGDSGNSPLRVRLEAREEIRIGTKVERGPLAFGCSTAKNPEHWPRLKIISRK